jgi:hypothetical protein
MDQDGYGASVVKGILEPFVAETRRVGSKAFLAAVNKTAHELGIKPSNCFANGRFNQLGLAVLTKMAINPSQGSGAHLHACMWLAYGALKSEKNDEAGPPKKEAQAASELPIEALDSDDDEAKPPKKKARCDQYSVVRSILAGGSRGVEAMKELDGKSETEKLRSELETCPTPDYRPVSPSPGPHWSDDDDDDDASSGVMHPVIGRMLTNREHRHYAEICEHWKSYIEAERRDAKRAASESPEAEPPKKKKARAEDTEAKAIAMIKHYYAPSFHAVGLKADEISEVRTKILEVQAFLSRNTPLYDKDTEWCVLFYEQYLAFDGRATRN